MELHCCTGLQSQGTDAWVGPTAQHLLAAPSHDALASAAGATGTALPYRSQVSLLWLKERLAAEDQLKV